MGGEREIDPRERWYMKKPLEIKPRESLPPRTPRPKRWRPRTPNETADFAQLLDLWTKDFRDYERRFHEIDRGHYKFSRGEPRTYSERMTLDNFLRWLGREKDTRPAKGAYDQLRGWVESGGARAADRSIRMEEKRPSQMGISPLGALVSELRSGGRR